MEINTNPHDRSSLRLSDPKDAEEFQKRQRERRALRAKETDLKAPAPELAPTK